MILYPEESPSNVADNNKVARNKEMYYRDGAMSSDHTHAFT